MPPANLDGFARRPSGNGETASWFVRILIGFKGSLAKVAAVSLVLNLVALTIPFIFQLVFDRVLIHRLDGLLEVFILALITLVTFETAMSFLRAHIFTRLANRMSAEMADRLFMHLFSIPVGFFLSRPVGEVLARCHELDRIRNFLTNVSIYVLLDLLFSCVFVAMMVFVSPTLALIALLVIPLHVTIYLLAGPSIRARLQRSFLAGAHHQGRLVESLSGIETVKSAARETEMRMQLRTTLEQKLVAGFSAFRMSNAATHLSHLSDKLIKAFLLFVGAKLVLGESITVGQLVAFNMLAARATEPLLRLSSLWEQYQQFRVSLSRIGEILVEKPESASGKTIAFSRFDQNITFENVRFRYEDEDPFVLHDINLRIEAGETIGIIGPSGSGKSTFTKLIGGLNRPVSGRVLLDGHDLADLDLQSVRRRISYVMQDNVIFQGTVRDNIAFRDPTLPADVVIEAARAAGADGFIRGLPNGYDTPLSERGSSLSAGQRQRIAIARALACEPDILIMDEATNALDLESEIAVLENLRTICRDRTVLIVSHRLPVVRHASRILSFENGRIIEEGSHETLLLGNGRYASLYRLQAA